MAIDTQPSSFPSGSGAELVENCVLNAHDPPPPYPSQERSSRSSGARSNRRRHAYRIPMASGQSSLPPDQHVGDVDDVPRGILSSNSATSIPPYSPSLGHSHVPSSRRRQSISHTSVASAAPSLTQTVLSLFQGTDDEDEDTPREGGTNDPQSRSEQTQLLDSTGGVTRSGYGCDWVTIRSTPERGVQQRRGIFTHVALKRYFRPLFRSAYYKALFHLLVLNFPYALVAWLYLFIFTIAGTTLLMALPLGAVLCFLDLLGARAFARGELTLQTRFHSPLAYPLPYPPRPIFTRSRLPTPAELELGLTAVPETSFYKNAYALFTDPTTYQALFYFIIVKPSITIILSLCLLIFVPTAFVLVLPAPAVLRAVRKLGAWQANVAIEGLYIAVR